MLIFIQLYLITCILFLAGKDADSYQLKDKQDGPLTATRIKRWHRDGIAIYILMIFPLIAWVTPLWWEIIVSAMFVRLFLFDIAFNDYASLKITYLGGTAWSDRLFVRIFGINGARRKAVAFFALLVVFDIIHHFYL